MTAHDAVVGVNATKRAAIIAGTKGVGDFIDGANEWGTKVRCIYDEYTVAAIDTLSNTCVLTFGTLPKGAKPLYAVWTQTQSGAAGATVGGILIGGAVATATDVLTTMTEPTTQIVSINNTFAAAFTTEAKAVTVLLATENLDANVNVTLSIFYIMED